MNEKKAYISFRINMVMLDISLFMTFHLNLNFMLCQISCYAIHVMPGHVISVHVMPVRVMEFLFLCS